MSIENEQKLKNTVELLKALVPLFNEVLGYMDQHGGWLPLRSQFFDVAKNPIIRKWPELYLDERKIKGFTLFGVLGQEAFKDLPDPAQFMETLKHEFAQALDAGEITTPSDAEFEHEKSKFAALDEAAQADAAQRGALLALGSITSVFHCLALVVHGRTLCQLVAEAMQGDDDAYRKAVQIDRTVLTLPYFQDRMLRAQFTCDGPFLKAVGDSLKRPIISSKIRHRTLWLAFALLDDEGLLAGLPHDRLLDICEEVGVYGKAHGVEDVGHLRKRLRDYRKHQRTSNIF
jgi:hypothetical protein